MKTLHEIRGEPTLLEFMQLRYPAYTWTINGELFEYRDRYDTYRDIRTDNHGFVTAHRQWVEAGADPSNVSDYP